jgi:hypothetical protein
MSMDGNMNLVSSLTAENLTFASESVTRGNAGVPKFQDFTINHQVFEALGGFRMELASPSTMTLTRTGFIPAEEAGLFYAMYSGFRDAPIHLLVTDPGFGSTPFELVGEQPTFIEIGLLTTIPAPGTIVAVGAIGLLATVRRRR